MMFSLQDFLRESLRIEGIHRGPTDAEFDATVAFLALPSLSVMDVCALVSVYAPGNRIRDLPGINVRVGDHIAPPGGPAIPKALEGLLERINAARGDRDRAFMHHVAYETLHPFTDGNGRSGRAIWLWQTREAPLGFLHHFYYQTLSASRLFPSDVREER